MNKYLSAVVTGLFLGCLSISAFAADAAKPVVATTASVVKAAPTAKVATSKVVAKKDTGIKATVKKLFAPDAKKTDLKLK
jgi:hypothetical protein